MRYELLIFLLLVPLLFSIAIAASPGTVTISLNSSEIWWNDPLNVSGVASYPNQTGVAAGTVAASIADKSYSCPATDANGNWYCVINAPQELGSYILTVTITNSTSATFVNTTTVNVKASYGAVATGTGSRVVYETPLLMQQLNGAIKKVWVRVKVWK